MTRFFISYDRDDRALTRQLAAQLRRVYGYNDVWFDENIYGGEHWWTEIRQQIANCDIFLFMLSGESAVSPYCEKERSEAERLRKAVLPVRIAPIQEIPEKLRDIQYVDMSEGQITVENFTELNAAIRQIAQRRGTGTRETDVVRISSRSGRIALVIVPIIVVVIALLGYIFTRPQQPFQGELTYTAGQSGIFIEQAGLTGVINQILGRNPRKIAVDEDSSSPLAWSPDKNRIAYAGGESDKNQIWVAGADGSNPQNLTNNTADNVDPAWSGNQIAFATNRDGNYEIYIMNADGSNPHNLTNNNKGDDLTPAWSPDGTHIAFASNHDGDYDIYVMNSDGSDIQQLTVNDVDDLAPSWSPDGLQIAFESNRVRTGGPGNVPGATGKPSTGNWDIYVTDSEPGGGANALTRSPGADRHATWSPDGKQIAFISDRNGTTDLYVKNLSDKTKDIQVVEDIDANAFPIWRS